MDNYLKRVERNITNKHESKSSKILKLLLGGYIFLSFFETYLVVFIGTSTKYYLMGVIFIFLFFYKFKIKTNKYMKIIAIWFLYKVISIMWSNLSNNDVEIHFVSQIGMVLFVVVLTGARYKADFLSFILKINYWCSFLFGVLSLLFSKAFISEVYSTRQVLTLFGLQNDPNNCAAFLCIGFTLALYSLLYEQKKYVINIIVFSINLLALLKTTSRAGLITVFVIFVVTLLFPVKKENKNSNSKKILLIVLLIVGGTYIATRYLSTGSLERLFSFKDYQGGSGRTIRWSAAIDAFETNPIFGCGWGGYVLEGFDSSTAIHNTFLTSLCDCGVIGTLLLLLPIFLLILKSIKRKKILVLLIILTGIIPSFFIDAINKRFFWNAIVISIILIEYKKSKRYENIGIWLNMKK